MIEKRGGLEKEGPKKKKHTSCGVLMKENIGHEINRSSGSSSPCQGPALSRKAGQGEEEQKKEKGSYFQGDTRKKE